MYDKYLKEVESIFENRDCCDDIDYSNKLLDCVIKIKTIQAMDTNAELIQASRRVSRN